MSDAKLKQSKYSFFHFIIYHSIIFGHIRCNKCNLNVKIERTVDIILITFIQLIKICSICFFPIIYINYISVVLPTCAILYLILEYLTFKKCTHIITRSGNLEKTLTDKELNNV